LCIFFYNDFLFVSFKSILLILLKKVCSVCRARAYSSKKKKTETKKSNDIYYKFEDDYFVRESLAQIKYKIPYDKKFADFIENSSEPQYLNILFLKAADFYRVIKEIQTEDLKKFES